VIPFGKIDKAETFARIMFDEQVNGHLIPHSQRILIFEDFDASDDAKVFQKRECRQVCETF